MGGFARSAPNPVLLQDVTQHRRRATARRALDIRVRGGPERRPLSLSGMEVVGIDLSRAMSEAAAACSSKGRMRLVQAPMDACRSRGAAST